MVHSEFPYSYSDLAVCELHRRLTVFFVRIPIPFVPSSIRIRHHTESMPFVSVEIPHVLAAIAPGIGAMSLKLVVLPGPDVLPSVWPQVLSLATQLVVDPVSFVPCFVRPFKDSMAVFHAPNEHALVP